MTSFWQTRAPLLRRLRDQFEISETAKKARPGGSLKVITNFCACPIHLVVISMFADSAV